MGILKKTVADILFQPIEEGAFAGSNIAEVFPSTGDTQMACGIHVIQASVTVVERAPVDDVVFVLDGEIQIESDGVAETFRAGEFAYLRAGERQVYTVQDQVRLLYVCYPRDWKQAEQPAVGD